MSTGRRGFLKGVGGGVALAGSSSSTAEIQPTKTGIQASRERVRYPRVFSGRQLQMIAFPLGGIGTGCISLGGRGQLRRLRKLRARLRDDSAFRAVRQPIQARQRKAAR